MTGRSCRLEPVDVERHAADLFAAYMEASDDRDWTYLSMERPVDSAAFRTYLRNAAESTDPLHFTIVDLESLRAVGTAALMRIDAVQGAIEVGCISYSPRLQRTHSATEAMYLLMRRVFDELGYRRYEWKCDSLNAPSRAAALRYGFTFEGVFRQAVVTKGRSRDTAWFSIIDKEWPRVRSALQSWLAPDNFDDAGQQRQSLAAIRDALP